MEDFMQKMQSILSDEESMQQLQELAQMFRSGMAEESSEAAGNAPAGDAADMLQGFDFTKLLQISSMLQAQDADKNTALLLALRPHLSVERQGKVDRAVKLLKLYALWIMLKESGMLGDLL